MLMHVQTKQVHRLPIDWLSDGDGDGYSDANDDFPDDPNRISNNLLQVVYRFTEMHPLCNMLNLTECDWINIVCNPRFT